MRRSRRSDWRATGQSRAARRLISFSTNEIERNRRRSTPLAGPAGPCSTTQEGVLGVAPCPTPSSARSNNSLSSHEPESGAHGVHKTRKMIYEVAAPGEWRSWPRSIHSTSSSQSRGSATHLLRYGATSSKYRQSAWRRSARASPGAGEAAASGGIHHH